MVESEICNRVMLVLEDGRKEAKSLKEAIGRKIGEIIGSRRLPAEKLARSRIDST
jgi:hypothetical protein